ncbi:hypothetical protein [Ornithinimicrobium avium]|uniref:Uncharacterized protein n=1 Tax=Ornithinimicrobium avium TaxID=2283195 RepID=A0A345NM31_9MICO|nr:hypothetical protein [Ornithinimicrobium avium]AXH96089.1 hypothetical protein DV701_08065 [Ornithinimicrobium avium]
MTYESAPGMPEHGQHVTGQVVERPQSVSLAQKLMYGGAAVTLVSGVLGLFGDKDALREQTRKQLEAAGQAVDDATLDSALQIGLVTGVGVMVVSVVLWLLLGWLNGRGVGWARIVATVLGILGVLSTVVGLAGSAILPGGAAGGALTMALSVLTGLIALAVVILLWRPDAGRFFAAHKQR